MAKTATTAAPPAAQEAAEFIPTAPSHDVVVYRGSRRVDIGSGRPTDSGNGIKVKLDHLPRVNQEGNIEQINIFLKRERKEATNA